MGLFNYLKNVLPGSKVKNYAQWYSNSHPLYSWTGGNVYLSDFVNNAIDRVASEISKVSIKSIVQTGDAIYPQNDDITRLFKYKPNPLQTTSDFLANVEWLRRKNCNAFVYPQYVLVQGANGQVFKRYVAFYPLNPTYVEIGTDDSGNVWEVKFTFDDKTYTVPYADLIHLKWRRGTNTVKGGGNDDGLPDTKDMSHVIDALNKTIDGLPKSIEASLQVKGVYHAKTLQDKTLLEKSRIDFESHITASKSGMIATDLAGEFTPVNINAPEIPDTAMKFLKSVIQERYGISAAILSGDYTGAQHSAFYQSALEDFVVQLEQAFTAACFTQREQDVGHCIRAYYSKINYMDATGKRDLATLSTNTGLMTLNQIADMYGLEPWDGGNRRIQSLNYMNIDKVDAYQMGKSGVQEQPKEEPKEDTPKEGEK